MNELIKNFFYSIQVGNLVAMISILFVFYTRLDSKIEKLSNQTDSKVERVSHQIDSKLDRFTAEMDSKIDKSMTEMDYRIDRAIAYLEEKIGRSTSHLESRIERIYTHMDQIERSVNDLDKRLCRIEGSLAVHSYCATHRPPEALPE